MKHTIKLIKFDEKLSNVSYFNTLNNNYPFKINLKIINTSSFDLKENNFLKIKKLFLKSSSAFFINNDINNYLLWNFFKNRSIILFFKELDFLKDIFRFFDNTSFLNSGFLLSAISLKNYILDLNEKNKSFFLKLITNFKTRQILKNIPKSWTILVKNLFNIVNFSQRKLFKLIYIKKK